MGGHALPCWWAGYSTSHNSSMILCKNDDGVDGDGDSGEIIDSDEEFHVYDNGDDNDGRSITNQYNCSDFETFQPCTGF